MHMKQRSFGGAILIHAGVSSGREVGRFVPVERDIGGVVVRRGGGGGIIFFTLFLGYSGNRVMSFREGFDSFECFRNSFD